MVFKNKNLKFTIEANKKVINFLDVTLDLNTEKFKPYAGNKDFDIRSIRHVNILKSKLKSFLFKRVYELS